MVKKKLETFYQVSGMKSFPGIMFRTIRDTEKPKNRITKQGIKFTYFADQQKAFDFIAAHSEEGI